GAPHNDQAVNTQHLAFMSLHRDIYHQEETGRVSNRDGPSRGPRTKMKRGILVLLSLSVLAAVGYFTASKWAIRHETIAFHDPDRGNRLVAVQIAVRRDKEMQANAGLIKLPVAVLNHGNTV